MLTAVDQGIFFCVEESGPNAKMDSTGTLVTGVVSQPLKELNFTRNFTHRRSSFLKLVQLFRTITDVPLSKVHLVMYREKNQSVKKQNTMMRT